MGEITNNRQYNVPAFLDSKTKIVAITAILYFLIAKLSLFIFVTKINILPFFPAIGFATAAVLYLGRKVYLGVLLGSLVFSISLYKNDFQNAASFEEFCRPLSLCIIRPFIACLNAFLVSYFSQLWCKEKHPFDSKKNVVYFVLASLLGSFLSVSICFIPLLITACFPLDNCILIWSNMLRGNAMGVIIFTPFVFSWLTDTTEFSNWSIRKKVEVFFLIITSFFLSYYVFETRGNNESILFFLLIWAAIRFGMKIITLVVIIITIIAIYCTGHNMGGFVFSGWNNDFLMLQLFLFVNMFSVLFLKAILQEKEREERKLIISEEKFRSIYESFDDIYFKKNLEGTLIDVSPSVEKHFKLKREDVIGTNAYDYYVDRAEAERFYENILQKKQVNDYEERFVTGTGEIVYFSVNAKVLYNSKAEPVYFEGTMRNVNERILNRKKMIEATEKIKASEEEFRAIFESFEDLYYRVSLEGIIMNVSPSVEKILKYKKEEIINSNAVDLYQNIEDRYKVFEILNEKGYINDFECIFKDKQGNNLYVSINARYLYDNEGNSICVEGTIRDISERKKNELEIENANQAIKQNEEKYRAIFESVRDVFFRASAKDHTILDISPSCSYFGLSQEEIVGKPIEGFYENPADRHRALKELIKNGEIKNYDTKFLLNSRTYYVSINSKIIFDQNDEPEFLIGSFRDITDRIQAEEKLKISELKFRSIYENFEDIYFKTELDGTIVDVSPSFERNFKMPCSYIVGKSTLDLYYDQQDQESVLSKLKKQGFISDFDAQFKDGDGNVIFLSINARFLYNDKGEPIYIEGSMRNINDRIAIQKELILKNRKLEFQNTELEQFAYIASHDLQEPLITVMHCIQLLQEELAENLDEDQIQYLGFINSSVSRMQLLVKGLLDYSRIGKERKTSRIDCNEIVANVLEDMQLSLRESNAIVEYENLPIIDGYSTEIRLLFQNMISNANKFQRKDQQPKIKISAGKVENNWLFSIQDNGIGIEEQDKDKVFVIFKRLHNRNEYQGTGIGLSHCKKIVEHHKGKIWVESKYNEGSTFKWTFPIVQN